MSVGLRMFKQSTSQEKKKDAYKFIRSLTQSAANGHGHIAHYRSPLFHANLMLFQGGRSRVSDISSVMGLSDQSPEPRLNQKASTKMAHLFKNNYSQSAYSDLSQFSSDPGKMKLIGMEDSGREDQNCIVSPERAREQLPSREPSRQGSSQRISSFFGQYSGSFKSNPEVYHYEQYEEVKHDPY